MNNQEPNSRIPSHIGHIDSVFIYLPELLLLMGIFTLNHLSRIGLSPLLPSIETDLGVRHSDVSLFFILISFGYCLMLIGSSFISAVITHKATIVISALGMGIILFALSLTRNISLMYFELFLLGLFTGLYLPSAIATITTKTNSKDWGKALAIHEIAPGLSYFIAPLLAEILLNIFTWRWMLVLVAFSSIIAGIIFGVKGKGGQFKGEAPKSERIMDLLHQPSLWLMIVIYSLRIPVMSSTESGHAVQWRREATLVREL